MNNMPEEKAKELIEKYSTLLQYEMPAERHREEFIKCAIIAVEEIIENHSHRKGHTIEEFNYWGDVLNHLKNQTT